MLSFIGLQMSYIGKLNQSLKHVSLHSYGIIHKDFSSYHQLHISSSPQHQQSSQTDLHKHVQASKESPHSFRTESGGQLHN